MCINMWHTILPVRQNREFQFTILRNFVFWKRSNGRGDGVQNQRPQLRNVCQLCWCRASSVLGHQGCRLCKPLYVKVQVKYFAPFNRSGCRVSSCMLRISVCIFRTACVACMRRLCLSQGVRPPSAYTGDTTSFGISLYHRLSIAPLGYLARSTGALHCSRNQVHTSGRIAQPLCCC